MRSSVGGRDLAFGFATWKFHSEKKRGRNMKSMSRHRLVSRRVVTWFDVTTWRGLSNVVTPV